MVEAPPYKGVQPILVPAAGQRLKISDYPDCFERLFYGQGLPIKRWADETFELPNKPAEVTPDVASDAKLIREFFYDLRDGKLHYKVRKVNYDIDKGRYHG